jgi:adenine phosphoribosyltransferase
MPAPTAAEIKHAIRNVPDFPKAGIQFKDITPVLADARLFTGSIDLLTEKFKPGSVDAVVGIDARGFIFAAAAAMKLNAGFVPVRKKGKLPFTTHEQDYALEYGAATIAMHTDALKPGMRVLLIDDLLATGGTASAAAAKTAGTISHSGGKMSSPRSSPVKRVRGFYFFTASGAALFLRVRPLLRALLRT